MLNFTRQERVVIYFLIVTLGVGALLKIVRNRNLDAELRPARFYEEEQRFKEVSKRINADSSQVIKNADDTYPVVVGHGVILPDKSSEVLVKINLNTATEDELDELPGIGPAIAKRIRAYTDQKGPFKNKADIILVKGIGEKLYTRIEGLVTIE